MNKPFFHNSWDYLRFYWPLAVLSLVMLFGQQIQVIALSRYPDGIIQLANLAVASSIMVLFRSTFLHIPQLVNVYGNSYAGQAAVLRFVLKLSVVSTVCFILLTWTPFGKWLLLLIFQDKQNPVPLENVQIYCLWYAPVLVLEVLRGYYSGLLIQNHKPGAVSILNTCSLVATAGFMFIGFHAGLSATTVVGGGFMVGALFSTVQAWWLFRRRYKHQEPEAPEVPTQRELWNYYYPVALTSLFYSITRPLVMVFAGRSRDPVVMLALGRLVSEISIFLVNPLNQFRHLYVTFGKVDMQGVRNCSLLVLAAIVAIMLSVLLTPLGEFLFGTVYGLQSPLKEMLSQSLWVMLLVPFVLTYRNYYHGLCMIRKVTGRMGSSGATRLAMVAGIGWILMKTDTFNQWTLPAMLVLGFMMEAWIIAWQFKRETRRKALAGGDTIK